MTIEALAQLTDQELLARVEHLAHGERRATVALVAHLAEMEHRRLYLEQGCGSLFTYCMQVLHLPEHAAYNRIAAARAARRFPLVLASLERGDVHLTAVRLLAPVLTPENHQDLLAAAKHKSTRQVEELVVRLRPQPDARARVSRLRARRRGVAAQAPPAQPVTTSATTSATATNAPVVALASAPAAAPAVARAAVVPLAPQRYKIQFTASAAGHQTLRRAQELLRHRIPNGDVGDVIELALNVLVQDLEKKKFAATGRPRPSTAAAHATAAATALAPGARPTAVTPAAIPAAVTPAAPETPGSNTARSRHVPAAVKRAVWERDGGRCAFVSPAGVRCTERGQLEFDHIRPHGDGGDASPDNLRLLCRSHNQYAAQQFFGPWQAECVRAPAGLAR